MPDWFAHLNNIGSISSIIGLLVTIFLFLEAKKIRNSFIRKARLPEVNNDLVKSTSQLVENLRKWDDDKNPSIEIFSRVRALLENIKEKLPPEEKKKVKVYLQKLYPKKYYFINGPLSDLSVDEAWDRYTELSGLITTLQQSAKDSKWD